MEMGNGVEMNMARIDGDGNNVPMENTIVYKIEVPANRYDLLCLEGIVIALRCYLSKDTLPTYKVSKPEKLERITVKSETKAVRQFVVSAILRNVQFDIQSYNSFIDLQDKLHQNICRRRTLCSMGTHDYDLVQGPITYEAHAPKDIKFRALKQKEELDCVQLFDVLRQDQKLKKFLHIIEDEPKYPVFYDANRTVLSLPPIINSDTTKISLNTKNVLIEVTGTDLTKCKIVLAILSCQFSHHCQGDSKFHVEPVEVVYEDSDLGTIVEPSLTGSEFEVECNYISRLLGIPMTTEVMIASGKKMGLEHVSSSENSIKFATSCVRPDILHACDIAEEVGIGYGFNNIPMVYPPTNTVGSFIPENKFTDLLRHEIAQAGYIESLTCALVSMKENYNFLRYEPNLKEAITLSNPKTIEYELVRTSLIPGLMKVLQSNQNERIPQKIFEISDTAVIDETHDTGARNHRKICLMQLNTSASFEVIHSALGLLMTKIGATHKDYHLQATDDDKKYFDKRGANVMLKGKKIGTIGVLHPEVIENFQLKNPVSVLELDLAPVWDFFKNTN